MMKTIVAVGWISLLGLWPSMAFAYTPHGWLWGDPFRAPQPTQKNQEQTLPFDALNPDEQVAVLRSYTLQAIHQMDIDPTPEHAKIAAEWLQFWSGKASSVMQSYRQMLLENPELDYHLAHPTEQAALSISKKLTDEKERAAIESLSQRYGIFYFYQGADPYEKALSPIIQQFSDKYHVSVIPISVDGISDDTFPNGRVDKGQAKKLHITHFPALMLINPQTEEVKPLHYGFITSDALASQFYQVATNFKGAS